MTNEEIWQAVLGEVELAVSPASFVTWFRDTTIVGFEKDWVVVRVPNGFAKEWLENKYNQFILKAINKFRENIHSVRCVVSATVTRQACPFPRIPDGYTILSSFMAGSDLERRIFFNPSRMPS